MAEQSSTALGCATLGILMALGLFGCVVSGTADQKGAEAQEAAVNQHDEAAEPATADKEEAAKIADGTHCVNGWDDSFPAFKDAVKAGLRNPASFEHIATSWSHAGKDGKFGLVMKYRAQNGFGGMNVEAAGALVNATTCEFEQVSATTLAKRALADPATS